MDVRTVFGICALTTLSVVMGCPGGQEEGDAGADDSDQAIPVGGPLESVTGGEDIACGLASDGSIFCWGALEVFGP